MPREHEEVIESLHSKLVGVRTCIDVGSGDGYELSRLECQRKIAIDAHPEMVCGFPGIEFWNLGIAEVSGKAEFWHGPMWGCSSLNDRGGTKYEIDVMTLDEFIDSHKLTDVDALIIDTEGTTWQVLQGAKKLLETVKYVYAEVQLVELYRNPQCRLIDEVTEFLKKFSLHATQGLPTYNAYPQANILYVRD